VAKGKATLMKQVAPHPPLREYYGEPSRREEFVRDIFDETAQWYDWTDRYLSFGSGPWYRRDVLKRHGLRTGMRMLDLASGTGVVARAASSITTDIVAADASIGMLNAPGPTPWPRVEAPAELLPFRDQSFDLIAIGFAMRHFADLAIVFSECLRVLRPGGRLLILEITAPASRVGNALLGAYMGRIVPLAVRVRTRSVRAQKLYRYYWETTRDCVRPSVILDTMREVGFTDVDRTVTLGIFSEYSATRSV
jgi:demethylmenaquinone methyltransferase/2-methoxy-6-polyprenyl-1,4-benzoquinol methylase